ncbi:MAG TPA: SRPBCC family protein [Blastocatellia bacterium]
MPAFERAIEINAGREGLFDLSQDYGSRVSWDLFLREARLIGDAVAPNVGVRAWCVARNGLGMETEYVTFKRPEVTAVKMTRGPVIFNSFAGSWRFEEAGPERTRVIFRYNFSVRPRWLSPVLNPFMKALLSRETAKRLEYLRKAIEGQKAS